MTTSSNDVAHAYALAAAEFDKLHAQIEVARRQLATIATESTLPITISRADGLTDTQWKAVLELYRMAVAHGTPQHRIHKLCDSLAESMVFVNEEEQQRS